MSPSPPIDPKIDVTLVASFGGSGGDSYYVDLAKKSTTSPANTPDLAGHISELEVMHKVLEGEIGTIA